MPGKIKVALVLLTVMTAGTLFSSNKTKKLPPDTMIVKGKEFKRFEVRSNRTVILDLKTGMMWQMKSADKTMTFEEAEKYADDLKLAGYDDWKLPRNIDYHELLQGHMSNDIEKGAEKPVDFLSRNYFQNIAAAYYWSGSLQGHYDAFVVHMNFGSLVPVNRTAQGGKNNVLCVRKMDNK